MFDAFGTQEKRLDILVNNAAALGLDGPFLQTKVEDWEAVFRVNVTAALLCTQLAARLMIPNQDGVIINISSNGARRGHRGRVAYDASKGALEAAGRSLALELAPYGIRVNNVVPGAIRTSRWDSLPTETVARRRAAIPLGREGLPDDVAGVVAFLCSVDAAYITGDTITVDGGMMAQLRPTRDDG
jgi:3-oxoacyl-[acyl-carrier protein] reductase